MGAGHFSITENLWKSDPGVIILYRIVTRGSLYPRVNILYDTGFRPANRRRFHQNKQLTGRWNVGPGNAQAIPGHDFPTNDIT